MPENIEETKKKLKEMGLSISCLTSSSCLFDESNIEDNIKEAKEYIETAAAIGTKYVRVLGDGQAEPREDISLDFCRFTFKTCSLCKKKILLYWLKQTEYFKF